MMESISETLGSKTLINRDHRRFFLQLFEFCIMSNTRTLIASYLGDFPSLKFSNFACSQTRNLWSQQTSEILLSNLSNFVHSEIPGESKKSIHV